MYNNRIPIPISKLAQDAEHLEPKDSLSKRLHRIQRSKESRNFWAEGFGSRATPSASNASLQTGKAGLKLGDCVTAPASNS